MQLYQRFSPSINETIDKATPYVKRGVDEATKVAAPLAKDIQTKGVPIVTVCSPAAKHGGAVAPSMSAGHVGAGNARVLTKLPAPRGDSAFFAKSTCQPCL